MKVCMFTLEYPPHVYGGVGRHVHNLVRNLRRFMDVEIRTMNIGSHERTVREYDSWKIFNGDYPRDRVLSAISLNLNMVRDEIDADIIHTHTWYMNLGGVFAKKLYGKKLVSTVHSLEPLRPWKRDQIGMGYNLSIWMEKTGLEESDGIVAVSKHMKEDIERVYGIEGDRIEVIYNGVNVEKYRNRRNSEFIESLGLEDGYVLFVGRLTRQKGIDTLLDASERINAKVVLVTGKADSRETQMYYRDRIKNKNVVWLHRYFTEEEIVYLYSHSSVFVCPSIYEPFGIINLEAMACEVPVVASDVGGISEIVQDGINGFLIPVGDAKTLAERVNYLLKDEDLRKEMGKNGRKRAMEFSWGKIAEKTYGFYRRIVNE